MTKTTNQESDHSKLVALDLEKALILHDIQRIEHVEILHKQGLHCKWHIQRILPD